MDSDENENPVDSTYESTGGNQSEDEHYAPSDDEHYVPSEDEHNVSSEGVEDYDDGEPSGPSEEESDDSSDY